MTAPSPPRLLALSDLHVGYPENHQFVAELHPDNDRDWLLLAGDVGESFADIEWVLQTLSGRFAKVIWTPGNHELWTRKKDPVQLRGEARYLALVELCRSLGILTPEDPFPVWSGPLRAGAAGASTGEAGPVTIAPMFLLYDYSFRPEGALTKEEGLAVAYKTGVVCSDEMLLFHDPYPSREDWCWARIEATERRLAELDPALPVVLVSHYPLVREPTRVLRYPQFAQWCGTTRTHDWHVRYNTATVVYGHLHIPRVTWYDGVRFEEVSIGYPREWKRRADRPRGPRQILPLPPREADPPFGPPPSRANPHGSPPPAPG